MARNVLQRADGEGIGFSSTIREGAKDAGKQRLRGRPGDGDCYVSQPGAARGWEGRGQIGIILRGVAGEI